MNRIILALDTANLQEALDIAQKVKNIDDHEQLTYIRIFDSEGARK